jgi:23S rRNA (pseudouridine1915-N3)-methyltransferase
MKLLVLAIGKLKPGPERELVEDYAKRTRALARQAGLLGLDLAEGAEGTKENEARWLLSKLPDKSFVVALDERGKALGTAAFTELIKKRASGGTPSMAFLIGGPDGHGEAVRQRADLLLAFGPQTWPHRLARVMLAEQIYRAVTIMVNHPYHRP